MMDRTQPPAAAPASPSPAREARAGAVSDPLTMLVRADTLDAQARGANAVWSACFSVRMQMRDVDTGEAVGFGGDWRGRIGALEVVVTCDGRTGSFRPLGPEPVDLLLRE